MLSNKMHNDWVKGLSLIAGAIALIGMTAGGAWAQSAAKKLYDQQCASCHGANGKGDGPAATALKPRPADFDKSLKGKSDEWIAKAISQGGEAVGESPVMPPYKDLSSEQVNGLVAYIKGFASK